MSIVFFFFNFDSNFLFSLFIFKYEVDHSATLIPRKYKEKTKYLKANYELKLQATRRISLSIAFSMDIFKHLFKQCALDIFFKTQITHVKMFCYVFGWNSADKIQLDFVQFIFQWNMSFKTKKQKIYKIYTKHFIFKYFLLGIYIIV